jgi:serine/threonine protein kinase
MAMEGLDRWQKLEEVFDAAVDLSPEEQRAFLDQACGEDSELRSEVEHMLSGSISSQISSVIGNAAATLRKERDHDPLIGSLLGPYRVTKLLGRGGMGAVYLADREDDQFDKKVAIKIIPRVLAGQDAIARFRAERQILASLEHPNIARLLDGGTSDGIPYLVMEYVEGIPITRYVSEQGVSIPDRLKLMQSVCSAVQHAHGALVVHRDLKPANILVSSDGLVKLLDFGVAKILDPGEGDRTQTATAKMMTPDYASPEQIRGDAVTTAADVYSLGVVLYELLTGERPYQVTGSSPAEIEKAVCKTEPRRPSEVEILPAKVRRRLAGDLDNIVLMALRKEASRRYSSVEQLSQDLQRYLDGEPVAARADTLWYRSSKFLNRNRWSILTAVVMTVAMSAATIYSLEQARVARQRFDQFRGFARTVLVDLHGKLSDIPGTAQAREALIAHVNGYLKRVIADNAEDDMELASEIATTYLRLGEVQGTTSAAIESYRSGQRLIERKKQLGAASTEDDLILARVHLRLGATLIDLGKASEGLANLNQASELAGARQTSLRWGIEASKIQAGADLRISRIYRNQYKLDEAAKFAGRSVQLCDDLNQKGQGDRELEGIRSGAVLTLAAVLRRQGHWKESLQLYRQSLEDLKRKVAANPASASLQRELMQAYEIVGGFVSEIPGGSNEARESARNAIAIAEKLATADPNSKATQTDLGQALSLGAEAVNRLKDSGEALRYLQRAVPIFQALLKGEPESGLFLLYGGITQTELGDALGRNGPTAESLQLVQNGVALLQKLVNRDPRDVTARLNLFRLQRILADNFARAGRGLEALAVSQEVITGATEFAQGSGPQMASPKRELARAYASIAAVYKLLGNREESKRHYALAEQEWKNWLDQGYRMAGADQEIEGVRRDARYN